MLIPVDVSDLSCILSVNRRPKSVNQELVLFLNNVHHICFCALRAMEQSVEFKGTVQRDFNSYG